MQEKRTLQLLSSCTVSSISFSFSANNISSSFSVGNKSVGQNNNTKIGETKTIYKVSKNLPSEHFASLAYHTLNLAVVSKGYLLGLV